MDISASATALTVRGVRAYLREAAENAQRQVVEVRSEALELVVGIDVLGRSLSEQGDGLLERRVVGAILELYDVLAWDDLDTAGRNDGSTSVEGTGGSRGGERQRKESEKSRGVHHGDGLALD